MRAADTNVLVRLVTRDDPQQVQAAESFIEKGAWVSQLVLAEATWVLSAAYGRSAAEIATAVLATTLSLAVIFVPVSFMSSISGRFLYQFGITAAVSVIGTFTNPSNR